VYEALSGVELILHAGDVGGQDILTELRLSAPVKAVFGNTHRQLVTELDGRLFVNPGAAGPKRFNLKPSVAKLTLEMGNTKVEIIDIS